MLAQVFIFKNNQHFHVASTIVISFKWNIKRTQAWKEGHFSNVCHLCSRIYFRNVLLWPEETEQSFESPCMYKSWYFRHALTSVTEVEIVFILFDWLAVLNKRETLCVLNLQTEFCSSVFSRLQSSEWTGGRFLLLETWQERTIIRWMRLKKVGHRSVWPLTWHPEVRTDWMKQAQYH